MLRIAHRFTAVATTLVVAVAHLACVCRAAQVVPAPPAADPVQSAHRCCESETPAAPSAPADEPGHDGNCRHCAGLAAAAAPEAKASGEFAGVAAALSPFAFAADVLGATPAAAAEVFGGTASIPPPALPRPTLLGLHCALNL